MFSSMDFEVSGLLLKVMMHFVNSVKEEPSLILMDVDIPLLVFKMKSYATW